MPSSNKGRPALVGGADIFDDDLVPTPDPTSPLFAIVSDYYWGSGVANAPAPVVIPYAWISTPLLRRPATVVNTASVGMVGGSPAYASNAASITQNGVGPANIDLHTDCDADPFNLAAFLVAYRATPRPRQPVLRLNLYDRTDAECLRIFRIKLGDRVTISDTEAGWPAAAVSFVIEGIRHEAGVEHRFVEFSTSTVLGIIPPTPGPWLRWDVTNNTVATNLRPF